MERQSSNGAGARGAVKREPVRRRSDRRTEIALLLLNAVVYVGQCVLLFAGL